MQTLFERLGAEDGIRKMCGDLVDLHLKNPVIQERYKDSDISKVKNAATTFFITGTGGPECYEGANMVAAHKGMNISNDEFVAVLDDALEAFELNGIGQGEREEAFFILYSMKNDICYG